MVVSGKMQQTVKNQHLQLDSQGVAARSALSASRLHADGEVACHLLRGSNSWNWLGRKRENVGRLVLAQKPAIQPANGRVRGQKHRNLAANPDRGLGFGEEA